MRTKNLPKQRIEKPITESNEALELYLKSERVATPFTVKKLSHLDQAIAIDPNFAHAYAMKAWLYWMSINGIGFFSDSIEPAELFRLARENVQTALTIDPDLVWVQAVQAVIELHSGNRKEVGRKLERALLIEPNNADVWRIYSRYLAREQEFDRSLAALDMAIELDPLNLENYIRQSIVYWQNGNLDTSIETLEYILATWPNTRFRWPAMVQMGLLHAILGDKERALESLHQSAAAMLDRNMVVPRFSTLLAYGLHRAGDQETAERVLERLEEHGKSRPLRAGYLALMAMSRDDDRETMVQLEKSRDQGLLSGDGFNLMLIHLNAIRDPMLESPEFVAVRNQMDTTD